MADFQWTSLLSPVISLLGMGHDSAANKADREQQRLLAEENFQLQRDLNQQNIDFQRETNAQNESLMREGWARDDSAYQRKAADLEAAGLSKTLAAGGGAMSSSPISLKAPQSEMIQKQGVLTPRMQIGSELMQMSQNFATQLRNDRIDALQEKVALQQIAESQSRVNNNDADNIIKILTGNFLRDTERYRKEQFILRNDFLRSQIAKFTDDLITSEKTRRNIDLRNSLLDKQLQYFDGDKVADYFRDVITGLNRAGLIGNKKNKNNGNFFGGSGVFDWNSQFNYGNLGSMAAGAAVPAMLLPYILSSI